MHRESSVSGLPFAERYVGPTLLNVRILQRENTAAFHERNSFCTDE